MSSPLGGLAQQGGALHATSRRVREAWNAQGSVITGTMFHQGESTYVAPLAQQITGAGAAVDEAGRQLAALLSQL